VPTPESRIASGDARRDGDLDAVRRTLLTRIGARREEVEEAIVAALLGVQPSVGTDPEGILGLRVAAKETVELIEELIAQGADWTPRLPTAVAAQARHLARGDVPLDTVMRGYYATISVCFEFATSEIDELPAATLPYLVEIQSAHGDYLMGAVAAEYEREAARLERSPGLRRLGERVERLLAGDPAVSPGFDYDLESWHLGLIALGPDAESTVRRLSERLGARLLLLPRAADSVWAWLGSARHTSFDDLEGCLGAMGQADVSLSAGESRQGVEGWRLTHREARLALEVAGPRPGPLTRCADVVLLAATVRDKELAGILVDLYLGPLTSRRDWEVLRATLRAYYAGDCNAASTAAALGVDRRTVRRRLRRVEEALGRRLDECRPEVEMALRVEEHGR
jgi:hypothetical protein